MLIRNALLVDGSGEEPRLADVAVSDGLIVAIGQTGKLGGDLVMDGSGLALAPGFIDAHAHDDLYAIRNPGMLPKLSQGVTTVIAGNCGISAAPVRLRDSLPDPMNLLGKAGEFVYPTFASYAAAVDAARPAVNVAAFAGHTALRSNHMDRLDRAATAAELSAMRADLKESLEHGALGLSTGLAYQSANAAPTGEVLALAELLRGAGAVYATHLRSEGAEVIEALDEAFHIGSVARSQVVVSHLKCAGVDNWGRSGEVLARYEAAAQPDTGFDCYPYAAGSSTLDLGQVDERVKITITWSEPHPEMFGSTLGEIATSWNITQIEAARRLQPGGAIYHSIAEADMRAILCHPSAMIGSDGLPDGSHPHPRLWGTFPRVFGCYSRDLGLFSLAEAVRKMTSLPAGRFGLLDRGLVREGSRADLVLFDPERICDTATFDQPVRAAEGIVAVWVNGVLSYERGTATGRRAGRFLRRGKPDQRQTEGER